MSVHDGAIEEQVVWVLRERLLVPDNKLDSEHWGKPLTGSFFRLSGVDLAYLFFELERRFDVRFQESDLVDYGFSTINKICRAVRKQVRGV